MSNELKVGDYIWIEDILYWPGFNNTVGIVTESSNYPYNPYVMFMFLTGRLAQNRLTLNTEKDTYQIIAPEEAALLILGQERNC
jgi:hypothetical protein